VHYILLGMADALCEAKCVDQGISAKCISCFGHNGVSQEEGEVDVLTFFYIYVCANMYRDVDACTYVFVYIGMPRYTCIEMSIVKSLWPWWNRDPRCGVSISPG
jgi:hypothetical protein